MVGEDGDKTGILPFTPFFSDLYSVHVGVLALSTVVPYFSFSCEPGIMGNR